MVIVSRGVVEPSCFLVVVGESGEPIEKASEAAERFPRFRYHCTPKGRRRKQAEAVLQSAPMQRVDWGNGSAEGNATIPLDNIRYNEYYPSRNLRRWPMMKIRKSGERGRANHGWLDSHFTFSFADYFDPEHVQFRTLRVMNDHRVAGGGGVPKHPHRHMQVVTYVLEGA